MGTIIAALLSTDQTIAGAAEGAGALDVEQAPQIAPIGSDNFHAAAASGFAGFAPAPNGGGYWIARTNGKVEAYATTHAGDMAGKPLNGPIVGIASSASGNGYWLVGSDGGIFSYGDAKFFGSMGGKPLNRPVIGMAATTTGLGYWLFASDGGIFSFGDAQFHGSTGAMKLSQPVVGMTPTPDGKGYWLVAGDGGIFAFKAPFHGSAAALKLQAPIVGVLSSDTGKGYRLVARDGGVFSYGDAKFFGSTGAFVGMPAMVGLTKRGGDNEGYTVVGADGRTWEFGPDVALPPAGSSPACTVGGVPKPADNSNYAFRSMRDDGSPARWSPCVPVHWQFSTPEAPNGSLAVIQAVMTKVSAQTGLKFVYDGTTTERAKTRIDKMYNDDFTGKPILIDFQTSTGPEMCGTGGCSYSIQSPSGRIMSSVVVLNKASSLDWSAKASMGYIGLHELGHTVGLNHANDTAQVMHGTDVKAASNYAAGDKSGLWRLGPGNVALSPDEYQ
jgi:hypothetical protein